MGRNSQRRRAKKSPPAPPVDRSRVAQAVGRARDPTARLAALAGRARGDLPFDATAFEHHRGGFILVPDPGMKGPITVVLSQDRRRCSCGGKSCPHLLRLWLLAQTFRSRLGGEPADHLAASRWYRLASAIAAVDPVPVADLSVTVDESGASPAVSAHLGDRVLFRYRGSDASRLEDRLRRGGQRAHLLELLAEAERTPTESVMNSRGLASLGQRAEASAWVRLGYHLFREGRGDLRPVLRVDPTTGLVTLAPPASADTDEHPSELELILPPRAVPRVLDVLAGDEPERTEFALATLPLRWIPRVLATGDGATAGDALEVVFDLELATDDGPWRSSAAELRRLRCDNLLYVPTIGRFLRLPPEPALPPGPLQRDRLPAVLDALERDHGRGSVEVDPAVGPSRILTRADRLEVGAAGAPEGGGAESWTWLAVRYRFGPGSLDLLQMLAAQRAGHRHVETAAGWVDLEAPDLAGVIDMLAGLGAKAEDTDLTALQLMRLVAVGDTPLELIGPAGKPVHGLLELRRAEPYRQPRALNTALRSYQVHGVEWLRSLHANGFGGLLCDDMGLGKTHQTMALLASLREQDDVAGPFLIVAPRTVLSHWQDKLAQHAPSLRAALYHGADRDLDALLEGCDIVLTSYGLLRRDAAALARHRFAAVVFDEIQHLKNRSTASWDAAAALRADFRLGLSGTPIENSVTDLKALFDVVLPGYLGSDERFKARYNATGDALPAERRAELQRLTAPFLLRRLKAAVLTELPDKIEDRLRAELSDQQAAMYREALATRGAALLDQIQDRDQPVPYVHVFALIDLLKQICNHPALVLDQLASAEQHRSGKWDLFQELLSESLDSGHKVVVFSHYLGMLELMARHLAGIGVGHVRLTGQSRNRGQLVDRFNQEPDCRVFLGSLMAGGTGIDLIAGSVVIHYDRWWNAAREEQATDRVHRFGQKQVVQVFKLVTAGTLEERIDRIIERKKALMESIVQVDDPELHKALSRDDLVALLQPLAAVGAR